jgi:hypothetical protein
MRAAIRTVARRYMVGGWTVDISTDGLIGIVSGSPGLGELGQRECRIVHLPDRQVVVLPRGPRTVDAAKALSGQDARREHAVAQMLRAVPAIELLFLTGDRVGQRELVTRGHRRHLARGRPSSSARREPR